MNPDTQRPTTPVVPPREGVAPHIPPRTDTTGANGKQQEAAANVVRSQIDAHFQTNPQTVPADSTTEDESTSENITQVIDNPYHHTHSTTEHTTTNDWQRYHSAWQQYYQQYYERYYVGAVYKTQAELTERAKSLNEAASRVDEPATTSFDKDEALYDIRSRLRSQIATSATKARKSRHFVPIVLAVCVMLTFAFLQYNSLIAGTVAAYVSPGNVSPANIIVDPTADNDVSPDPRIIIPKINVDAPVHYDTVASSYDSLMKAMDDGVAYFGIPGANALPGQAGNFGLSGHSSSDVFSPGNYKFIFVHLDRLQPGDTIYINYQGKRYTYNVTGSKVVEPNDAQALVTGTTKPTVTLITCTPSGTALHRLLVTATQVSPDPSAATAAPAPSDSGSTKATMPGNGPSILEQMFGAGG